MALGSLRGEAITEFIEDPISLRDGVGIGFLPPASRVERNCLRSLLRDLGVEGI